MVFSMVFKGFPEDLVVFFEDLSRNNDKEWFNENRERYEASVLGPSKEFVIAMGERLREIAPDIVAIPKVNGSLFRLNRDTRFSPDKTPYKDHMGIIMWQGSRKRMENPGYYFHLEPGKLMVGAGLYMFPKDIMEMYRKAVIDDKLGRELEMAIVSVESKGYSVREKKYKRVPKDHPQDHERGELLKYGGMYAIEEGPIPGWVFEENILDELIRRFDDMRPIQEWMLKVLGQ
jgi:uncharacterized protein (TIGR02453 family)